MSAGRDGLPEVHFFEPSGYAGIFQHTCQVGEGLHRRGWRVVLHTGHEHEEVKLDGVELCACSWWPRASDHGRVRSLARRAAIAQGLIERTVPHLLRSAPTGAVLHLQGTAATGALNALTLALGRRTGHRVVYSPHDTFSRRSRVDGMALRLACQAADAVIVHSRADQERLRRLGVRAFISPLVQLVPRPSESARLSWRREWRADESETLVLFAGFIRPEKRLDLLIESARSWPPGRRLAVVGTDWGGWARCGALARSYDLDVSARLGFVELPEFTAAISAADLVVVPSDRASQSGVLALARLLGTPSVAADVGGMAELASSTFTAGDVTDLSRAIQAQLADSPVPVAPAGDDDLAVSTHLRAYG
jgi:glycosyltransferase involved in cell wall biosynthesis